MSEKLLTEREVIRLMRETYDQTLQSLMELDTSGYSGQEEESTVLDIGLKIRHKKTNLLYTIVGMGVDDIMLQTPDGEEFAVAKKELEKEYKLD